MEIGLFTEFDWRRGVDEAQAFDDSLHQVTYAEDLGYDAVWLAELHFQKERSVLSSPLVEESFEIVRRALAGERVTLQGWFWQADDLVVLPLPERPIPLMIGSNGPRMLAATLPHVERWNMWYARYGNTVEGFSELNAFVTEQCEIAGRDPATVYRSTAVLVELDPDAAKRPHSDKESPPVMPDDLPGHLRSLEEAGADEAILILRPITEASIRTLGPLLSA